MTGRKICPLCRRRVDYGGFEFEVDEKFYVAHIACVVDVVVETARIG